MKLTAELMNEIDQCIHKIDRLKADIAQYERDINEHNERKPQPPKVVLDYEEYNQYLDDLHWWQTTLKNYQSLLDQARENYNTTRKDIMAVLPRMIWFRTQDGTLAYGISYDNWGGGESILHIVDWSDNLYNLDRRGS
jgi:predicted  nucleic acid-binding Zn-ribbon protein